ncbi:MAG: hypothetical protein ACKVT1_06625 [Dehalococcoidia bacterium]
MRVFMRLPFFAAASQAAADACRENDRGKRTAIGYNPLPRVTVEKSVRFMVMGDKSPKNTQKTTKQKVQAKTAKPAAAAAAAAPKK